MSKIILWSLLGGRAVTASCLSFIVMQINTTQKMPHASFLSPVQKNERLLIFFLSGVCEPLKNVGRKFHWEKITNMASVSCVCGLAAVGSR